MKHGVAPPLPVPNGHALHYVERSGVHLWHTTNTEVINALLGGREQRQDDGVYTTTDASGNVTWSSDLARFQNALARLSGMNH